MTGITTNIFLVLLKDPTSKEECILDQNVIPRYFFPVKHACTCVAVMVVIKIIRLHL